MAYDIPQIQVFSNATWILLLSGVVYGFVRLTSRPKWPKTAPKFLKTEDWPVLGALRFFSDRRNFVLHGTSQAESNNFSFYFGKHQLVGMGGQDARKAFFESKELSMSEGYAVFLVGTPDLPTDFENHFNKWFNRSMMALMRRENFVKNLDRMVADTRAALERIEESGEGIMDPFDHVYRAVYQLTMRTVGANEIADSPAELTETLHLFEIIERASSPVRIIFPWLPTPEHLYKMWAGWRLYVKMNKIVDARRKEGRVEDDALQFLLDGEGGGDVVWILSFVIGALYAGQVNTGVNAAWMLVYLAATPEWYKRVQDEVDAALNKHRVSADQSPVDILALLTVDDWESEFPMLDLCSRETIRLQMAGTAIRKNIGGKDVPIGKSGEVIPKDGFAVYLLDDIHFDPEIYSNPHEFDPGRYLPDRAEDKKVPLAYLGWGAGRHPCLGMKFAKLEATIIGVLFTAMYDYSLQDVQGQAMPKPPPMDRDRHSSKKPDTPMRLKFERRGHASA
ncbi:cytochrome P450 6A1 [Bombardia bombarda]|uniref:Cytochrome P450 6A1 n=1 Tax=Bombardia bombarda TaxID=252184 RepID=A0AA40CG78_9PEZI|nr:cytochrome P450 6A1 [Bombardia bombarda]